MLNRTEDGSYLSSMHESMKLLARYVDLAEHRQREQLEREIDENNQDVARHPNEIVFGMAIVLGWFFRHQVGRSCAPWFASQPMTRVLAQYVRLAEERAFDQLHALIERNTNVPANNPSKLIYHSVLALGEVWARQTGRSLVPVFRRAAERWEESPEEMVGRLFG